LAREKDCLNVQLTAHQLAEDVRNVAAAFPTSVEKDCELFGVESQSGACDSRCVIARKRKLGMHRHAGNLYFFGGDAIFTQLLARLIAGDEIKPHIVTCPAFPKSIERIRNDSHQGDAISEP